MDNFSNESDSGALIEVKDQLKKNQIVIAKKDVRAINRDPYNYLILDILRDGGAPVQGFFTPSPDFYSYEFSFREDENNLYYSWKKVR